MHDNIKRISGGMAQNERINNNNKNNDNVSWGFYY